MAYVQKLPVRFQDVDYARIVYYPRLFDYCHRVFEDFFAAEVGVPYAEMLMRRKVGYPSVHAAGDFKAPLTFGDIARVEMDTVKLSTRSITSRYRFYKNETDTLCATFEVVTVAISMDTFKPVEIPEDVRVAFLNHLVGLTV
ncbi:MAG: acyl-CoA thioesterase [Myxococcota bacterium]